jgi:hypothetical protein
MEKNVPSQYTHSVPGTKYLVFLDRLVMVELRSAVRPTFYNVVSILVQTNTGCQSKLTVE